jgi:hypothetical protein
MKLSENTKRSIKRFIKAGIFSAAGSMLAVQVGMVAHWIDLMSYLNQITIAGLVGFITGSLMSLEKGSQGDNTLPTYDNTNI